MRIAIVGAGGVGGYFGARLAAAGSNVSFVARGAHLEALRTHGLTLESPKGDLHLPHVEATDDPRSIGPVDVVLFTVKLYDAEAAAQRLTPLLGPGTVVIPFQNGVDSIDVLSRAIDPSHVASNMSRWWEAISSARACWPLFASAIHGRWTTPTASPRSRFPLRCTSSRAPRSLVS